MSRQRGRTGARGFREATCTHCGTRTVILIERDVVLCSSCTRKPIAERPTPRSDVA